jgi:hypothetical protein
MARQWRKSAAYALANFRTDNVKIIRYEDLVTDSDRQVRDMLRYSGITCKNDESYSVGNWHGNSSFTSHNEIATSSVGRYRNALTPRQQKFVEALCFYEMKSLGYEPKLNAAEIKMALQDGPDIDYKGRKILSHYEYSKNRIEEETQRYKHLISPKALFDPSVYLFEESYFNLRKELFK